MGLMASDTGGGNFELAPEGTHLAICDRVIDLGLQLNSYGNMQRKVMIGFRLVDETGSEGQALGVANRYTLSLSERAILRQHLESWRGKAFTAKELKGFDVSKLLNVPALVSISHDLNPGNGKTYANITGISGLPKSMARPEPLPRDELKLYIIGESPDAVLRDFHEKLQETIATGRDNLAKMEGNKAQQEHAAQQAQQDTPPADFDDDIPF